MAQSGLCAVQRHGILADGAVAQAIGARLAASRVGLTPATIHAISWTHLRAGLIQAQRTEVEATGA